jgi:hypothetical protein
LIYLLLYSNSRNFPIKLNGPAALQDILRNVTLNPPDNYKLIVGTRTEHIHLYYQIANVSVVVNARYFVNIPLKTTASHFTLHIILILPERVSSGKFIQYSVYYPYFATQTGQQDYTLLSETDFSQCSKGDIVVCPANTAVYSAHRLTCKFSLFFQTVSHYRLCKRALLLHHQTPTIQRMVC